MIRHLFHALGGVAAILVVGYLLALPSFQKAILHHKAAHYAIAGLLLMLVLFVLASIWGALKSGRKPSAPSRPASPYATTARRR